MKCAFLLCDTSELLHYCVQRSDHWNVQATGDLSSLRLASQDLSLLIDPVPEGPDPILNERLIEADVTAPYLYLITCRMSSSFPASFMFFGLSLAVRCGWLTTKTCFLAVRSAPTS